MGYGTFAAMPEKVKATVARLAGEIMTLQSKGDAAKARKWLQRTSVPVDIEPRFTAAEALH